MTKAAAWEPGRLISPSEPGGVRDDMAQYEQWRREQNRKDPQRAATVLREDELKAIEQARANRDAAIQRHAAIAIERSKLSSKRYGPRGEVDLEVEAAIADADYRAAAAAGEVDLAQRNLRRLERRTENARRARLHRYLIDSGQAPKPDPRSFTIRGMFGR